MRVLDLFSGIGGFTLAFEKAGFQTIGFSEIEPFACKVLAHHWHSVPNLGDVTKIKGEQLGRVDVITGGFPCQDLSVAGKRRGLAGDRSGLFWEIVRLAKETRASWLVLENVPGLLSSHQGRDFGVVLDALGELGYGLSWRVLDAQHFGVPQRRRRVFIVGCLGTPCPPEILFEPEGVRGDIEAGRAAGEEASRGSGEGTAFSLRNGARDADTRPGRTGIGLEQEVSFALQSEQQHAVAQIAGTLGGGSGSRGWASDTDRMTFVVKGSAVGRAPENGPQYGEVLSDGTCYTLNTVEQHCVAGGISARYAKGPDSDATDALIPFDTTQITSPENRCQPKDGDPSHPLAAGAHPPAIAFNTEESGKYATENISPPLRTESGDPHMGGRAAVAFALRGREGGAQAEASGESVSSLRGASGGSSRDYVATHSLTSEGHDASEDGTGRGTPLLPSGQAVRRLTPLECERLQGFPDGWTDIPGASDSAQYRALGNAVAVPVIEWIARRLAQQLQGEEAC